MRPEVGEHEGVAAVGLGLTRRSAARRITSPGTYATGTPWRAATVITSCASEPAWSTMSAGEPRDAARSRSAAMAGSSLATPPAKSDEPSSSSTSAKWSALPMSRPIHTFVSVGISIRGSSPMLRSLVGKAAGTLAVIHLTNQRSGRMSLPEVRAPGARRGRRVRPGVPRRGRRDGRAGRAARPRRCATGVLLVTVSVMRSAALTNSGLQSQTRLTQPPADACQPPELNRKGSLCDPFPFLSFPFQPNPRPRRSGTRWTQLHTSARITTR